MIINLFGIRNLILDRINMQKETPYKYYTLFDGYSYFIDDGTKMKANCTCSLIKGPNNVIVDTMTPWDKERILEALATHDLEPNDINYVVSTHGHSDHLGNNNLFLKAKHIVGFNISYKDEYYIHSFEDGIAYVIDSFLQIVPTPGHTLTDITVKVHTEKHGAIAIAGDLFECEEDIKDPRKWLDAGSEDEVQQKKNRAAIASADWIVPGHGPMFKVTKDIRQILISQAINL